MLRSILAASAVAAVACGAASPAVAGMTGEGSDRVIVVDAPDVQKLNSGKVPGFRTSEVIGTDVYSNSGKRIGEVEDFVMSGNGYFYAVVDIQEGVLERTIDLTDDELVVVPWNQLRVSPRDQVATQEPPAMR